MSIPERIYSRLPASLQTAVITAKGAQYVLERYGRAYHANKHDVRRILQLDAAAQQRLQLERLRGFLSYAKEHSTYFASALSGLDPRDIKSVEGLRELPVLEKDTLRACISDVYTLDGSHAIEGHTGGTTGKSLVVRFLREDFQSRMANLDVFREIHGARHRMRRATFSGKDLIGSTNSSKLWRTNWALNQRFYSTFHMKEGNLGRYIDDLNRFKPQIIDGFVSCIVDLCSHLKATGRTFDFQPIGIFPTSEPLFPHQRAMIHDTLGVEPRDQYASSEGAPFIVECLSGRLHFWTHTGVIETDEDGSALVTAFDTRGTPLIRYRIGDRITFAAPGTSCSCGWEFPVVDQIEGRSIDYLLSPERGRIYSPNLANVVKNVPNSVIKTQFVQSHPDRVTVKLVVDEMRFDHEADAATIRDELHRRLGEGMTVDVRVVDDIARAPSGKHRLVINDIL